MNRRQWLTTALFGAAGAAAGVWHHRRLLPPPRASGGPSAHLFPDVPLVTHEGRRVRLYDDLVKGDRIVVIDFMYATCEGVCTPITRNLVKVAEILGDRMGRDVFFLSLTLKPELDTPAVLAAYAKENGTGPGWTFLTGRPADLEWTRKMLGFVDPDPELDKDRTQHSGVLRYGNDALHSWAACPGLANPAEIVRYLDWMRMPTDDLPTAAAPG